MTEFIAWVMIFLAQYAPPGRPQYLKEAIETKEEATARYESIAKDIATVVFDEDEKVITGGDQGRLRMASIILSIILHESGVRKDVDYGLGKQSRGDGGRSWCLMQLQIGKGKTLPWNKVQHRFFLPKDPPEELAPQYTGEEIIKDRVKCIRSGLHVIVGTACTRYAPGDWLKAYASGSCSGGAEASRSRMNLAIRWFATHTPTFTDADVAPDNEEGESDDPDE
jgi:hypothetical protein